MKLTATRRQTLMGAMLAGAAIAPADETLAPAPARPDLDFAASHVPDARNILAVLNYTAAAQIAALSRPIGFPRTDPVRDASANWVSAAFYVGAARLARVSDEAGVRRFLTAVAEHYNYAHRGAQNGHGLVNADEFAIGDLYAELYALRRQAGMLMPLKQRADFMLPHLILTPAPQRLVWWWCDALFMAPPVLARLSALTGDPKYLAAMDVQWRRTHARLYDSAEKLYCRDERFITRRAESGAKIFWSRGQGWVLGGLARVLESMPADFSSREFYVQTFREMATRLAALQHADGLWRASLLDPAGFTEPENSGSAFFVYGMAWGINHGLLDRRRFLPHVLRGWAALTRYIQADGLLGSVQRTGDQPVATQVEDKAPYGTGALLLAGLEVMRLSSPPSPLPLAEPSLDPAEEHYFTAPPPPAPQTEAQRVEAQRRAAERAAVDGLGYDPDLGH